MENHKQSEGFRYTYSAKEQEELRKIRQKYASEEEDKMEHIRRLDASATGKGTLVALIIGVIGTLVMGVGMCCCLVWQGKWFIPGIIIGCIGIFIASIAYPIYNRVVKKEREKIAPEILRLTDELMK